MNRNEPRHLISLRDLSNADIDWIVRRGTEFAAATDRPDTLLAGKVLGVYFSKTSTRTRTAFTVGALRLGAEVIAYGPGDLQLNTGETVEDTARVLAGMLDGMVIRIAGDPREIRAFAAPGMPVVNAMSADEHPTQALADLTTLAALFGGIKGLRVLYVGEGNNTAAALALGLARFADTTLELRTPPGYGVPDETLAQAKHLARRSGSTVVERHDMADLPRNADVVYTTRWQTTGTSKPDPDWRRVFAPFQVNEEVMERCSGARFLHDLPAHRGEEVTAGVLDGPASIAFEQARNKLHSAMAVLEWCMVR
ncbi:ornithine carbamoyltransferase [Streptomyces phaeolivaceus]|uniref:Ornithine carbamoyltransferase n=1 Tax=Streptomyces phaeolivaceus TaxID=2653200 RepID=A0A5P8K842_9ACTN|nr:ornithine carbamoyltransferase [Streptomyces phaeolivaceus]QFQ99405.1 ornithine carbamoyltransferase [Streptomyces phaeolivaceus]